jgi:hypothetical protein
MIEYTAKMGIARRIRITACRMIIPTNSPLG